MIYRHAIGDHTHVFADLRDLMAKATPPRSGDRLAGIAAETAEQMIAARMALADVPLGNSCRKWSCPTRTMRSRVLSSIRMMPPHSPRSRR